MRRGQIATIARASTLLWRRELASIFGIGEKALVISFAVFIAAMVAFSIFLAWTLGTFVASVAPVHSVQSDQRSLLRLVLAGLMSGTAVYFLIVCSSLPPRDRLSNVLAVLPVTRWRAEAGTLLPALAIGLAIAFVFGFPTLPMLIELVDPNRFQPGAVVAFVVMIGLSSLLVPGIFFAVRDLMTRMTRMPLAYSLAIAVGVTLLAVFAIAGGDLIPRPDVDDSDLWSLLLLPRAMSEVLQPGASDEARLTVAWSALGLWTLLAVGLIAAAIRQSPPLEARAYVPPSIRMSERGAFRAGSLMVEVVVLTRLPQFIVSSLVLFLSAVVFPLLFIRQDASVVIDQIAGLPVVIAFALGAYSYGSTRRSHWVGTILGRPRSWVGAKLLASFLVSAVMAIPYLSLMWLAGLPSGRMLDITMLGIGMWCSAVLAGRLVPFAVDQPLSATVTSATTAGLWTLSTFGSRWLFTSLKFDSPILPALSWAVVAIGAYFVISARASERVDSGA